ncbi:MAG: toxin-antitoxin system YwqK family antitoxin [Helicobacteraceae bacterium]|jgi:antitoxin component YwqK of YwqJK toxin-antitoxin module|nr:toxin-antitoxin system YwqK family antitoxin [Helicobacteraceae bacterium]
MKRILIAILLAAACQGADLDKMERFNKGECASLFSLTSFFFKTACLDNGKCMDMKGNLLSGKTEVQDTLKDGTKVVMSCIDGEANEERGYFDSGKLKYIALLKNGKREGIVKYFYENGKLGAEEPYKNGKIEGIAKFLDDSGKLQEETPYKNDVKDGIGKFYDKDGKLKGERVYKNNRIEEKKVFRENGTAIFTYKNGKIISGVCYKANGEKVPFTKDELKNWDYRGKTPCD